MIVVSVIGTPNSGCNEQKICDVWSKVHIDLNTNSQLQLFVTFLTNNC